MDQYQCFQCGMVSEDEVVVKNHLAKAHLIKVESGASVRKFSCSLCIFTTTSMEEYKNHLINTHNKEKHNWMVEEIIQSFVCEECDLEFPKSSMLLSHTDIVHNGDKVIIEKDISTPKIINISKDCLLRVK